MCLAFPIEGREGDRYVLVASQGGAPEDPGWVPPWLDKRWEMLVAEGGARLALRGVTAPGAGEGVDPARAGAGRGPRARGPRGSGGGRRPAGGTRNVS